MRGTRGRRQLGAVKRRQNPQLPHQSKCQTPKQLPPARRESSPKSRPSIL